MDVEPRFIIPDAALMTITADQVGTPCWLLVLTGWQVLAEVDERTIGVVAILGNHYTGHYDPVWEVLMHCSTPYSCCTVDALV